MKIRVVINCFVLFFKEYTFIYKILQSDWANWSQIQVRAGCMGASFLTALGLGLLLFFCAEHDLFALFSLSFPKISVRAKFIDVETLPNRNLKTHSALRA